MVAPPASQIISELLCNNADFNANDNLNDGDKRNEDENNFYETAPQSPIITLSTRTHIPDSRENRINIMNNTHNVMNTSRHHFDTTTKIVSLPFDEMTICSWLCANSDILQLSNNMHLSMQTPVVEGLRLMPSTVSEFLTTPQHQENKMQSCCDFLEELKYLFLRIWNPQKCVLEELIRKVIKCELNSAEGIEWLHTANRHFGDFRNKLVNGIVDLIDNFKESRKKGNFYFYF
ncbi:hypothetical protein RhiirA4_477860 [Rhizophagus irregularis]|uniref:Uncharacterized protein n=1 Tax=Rhizophagus irregularis TaxID=588596 RepID=A0A2I1HDV3_9GLOM|nr:hypothetical protein RhiirA4_477860 [Rhizophagus irregularis]